MKNNRLPLSLALSLLVHLFIFIAAGLLLQFHAPIAKVAKLEILEVRLVQPAPSKAHPQSGKTILTVKAPAQFKIAQPDIKNTTTHIPTPISKQAAAPSEAVEGIAFPGVIATPFAGSTRANHPIFQAQSSQQDAARTYYQQAMRAQANQQSAQQAQIIILQLQQVLAKQLDVQPLVTGKCNLVEDGVNNRLKCDSGALYEVVSGEQNSITAMLITLRSLGQTFSGFSAEINAEKPSIKLLNDK